VSGDRKPLLAVLGPTATGKSALGIAIAERVGGEIINCDSTAVFRGFDIGTDKVPASERRGIPHHLVDIVPPEADYNAADFARDAAGSRFLSGAPASISGRSREACFRVLQRTRRSARVWMRWLRDMERSACTGSSPEWIPPRRPGSSREIGSESYERWRSISRPASP